MKITILTDNPKSWIIPYIEQLKIKLKNHQISHIFSSNDISDGDVMLILSCEKILNSKDLSRHKRNIVVHPSKLPLGKGWSPLAYQVLDGVNRIPISLFEANEKVDNGDIYLLDYIELEGHELNNEIKHQQGIKTIEMIIEFIEKFNSINGIPQVGEETFYAKRTKENSELNINKTIKEQFNLLRIVDNERYPAYFYKDCKKYVIKIFKEDD